MMNRFAMCHCCDCACSVRAGVLVAHRAQHPDLDRGRRRVLPEGLIVSQPASQPSEAASVCVTHLKIEHSRPIVDSYASAAGKDEQQVRASYHRHNNHGLIIVTVL